MEAGKLMSSCIGSPLHPLCPPSRGIRTGSRACKIVYAVKSSNSCDTPSALASQLSLLALSNLACLPVWAAEGASSASVEVVSENVNGASVEAASQAVQSSVESVKDAASQTSAGDSNMLINILGAAAFVGLSLLTVAVVYLFITDFLEKRKNDEEMKRLNEEAAAASKKKSGSLSATSQGGAKGFGRKRQVDDE